jgi:hypothetical protein
MSGRRCRPGDERGIDVSGLFLAKVQLTWA